MFYEVDTPASTCLLKERSLLSNPVSPCCGLFGLSLALKMRRFKAHQARFIGECGDITPRVGLKFL